MTVAELKKILEDYKDDNVIILKSASGMKWDIVNRGTVSKKISTVYLEIE